MFSFESPQGGDSNENTQYTIFNMNKMSTLNYPTSAAMGFFQGTQERVRNSRGKRAISVRAIEVLLYIVFLKHFLVDTFYQISSYFVFFLKLCA